MIEMALSLLFGLAENMAQLEQLLENVAGIDYPHVPDSEFTEVASAMLKNSQAICNMLGLVSPQPCFERASGELTPPFRGWQSAYQRVGEVRQRILDELGQRRIVLVSVERARFLDSLELFGPMVTRKFSKAVDDIEEAGKCFAYGWYTATAFQLMRVMEPAIHRLAKKLGVVIGPRDTWGELLARIDPKIRSMSQTNTIEKAKRVAYEEIAAHVRTVKNAWRDLTMHATRAYTEEQAQGIFQAVKALMQSLAKVA